MASSLSPKISLPSPVFTNKPFFKFDSELLTTAESPMESSIRNVMTRYGTDTDVRGSYLLPSYRCLRRLRPMEENQAVAITHDEKTYKIMVDVNEFKEGSINVRAVGDHELVVEGIVETSNTTEENSSKSSFSSSRKFQQRVMFPDLDVCGVTSTVSSDGVLTILAPRKPSMIKFSEAKIPIEGSNTSSSDETRKHTTESNKTIEVKTEKTRENIVPIQMEKVVSQNNEVKQTKASTNNREIVVPIHKKGSFFQDSFFETDRQPFQVAIDNIKRQMEDSMKLEDPFKWYSNVRCSDSLEDHRAGTITTEKDVYKIVIEVKDFNDGSLNIKSFGGNVILVEGKMDKKTEGSTMSKKFLRRFVLPGNVQSEKVTSALSSEGILTIIAPKQEDIFKIVDVTDQMTESNSIYSRGHDASVSKSSISSNISDIKSEINESIIEEKPKSEIQIPVSTVKSTSTVQTGEKNVDINYINKNHRDIEKLSETMRDQKSFEIVGETKDLTDCNVKMNIRQRKTSSGPSNDREIPTTLSNFPIVRRGPFYQDSFFTDFQKNYQIAVRNVLNQWFNVSEHQNSAFNSMNKSFDWFDQFDKTLLNYRSILDMNAFEDLTCYKSLTNRNFREESQARSFIESKTDYKIILDVHGFSEDNIKIQAVNTNEIIVEGHVESNTPGSKSVRRFKKEFILPSPVRINAVTSALSADHVLTITVPKNTALSITA